MPPKARPAGAAGAPPAKRLRVASPPLSPLSTILIGGNLLTVDQDTGHIEPARQAALRDSTKKPAYEALVRRNPTFKKLERHYATATPLQQQLANLTAQSLVRLGTIPGVGNGTLDSVDLRTVPARTRRSSSDYYLPTDGPDGDEQRITFSPNHKSGSNSLIGFTHEGRHALDDIHRTPHQLELINFLAQEERRRGTPKDRDTWLQPLLKGAQDIIGSRVFNIGYTYPGFFAPNITASFGNLEAPTSVGSPYYTSSSKTFEDAKRAIAKDRSARDPSGDAFMALSEFPAFMTEQLGTTFQGPTTTPGINNISRRFIKENLRTMYRDYNELLGGATSLADQYPDVHNAFFDRYNELRNPNVKDSPYISIRPAVGKVTGAPKAALDAFTPGVAPTPNPFPAPKYTTRAKGGHVKNPSQNNFDIKRQLQLLALLSPRLEFL